MRNKSNLTKLDPKIKEKGVFPTSIYHININPGNKPDQDIIRKEDQRPVSLTNIGAKIHYQILADSPAIHKNIYKMGFNPEM